MTRWQNDRITNTSFFFLYWNRQHLIIVTLSVDQIMTDNKNKVPFHLRLKLCLITLLKFFFTPIITSMLKLVSCVWIAESRYLYVYADVECYVGWQWFILIAVIPVLVLFPFFLWIIPLFNQTQTINHQNIPMCGVLSVLRNISVCKTEAEWLHVTLLYKRRRNLHRSCYVVLQKIALATQSSSENCSKFVRQAEVNNKSERIK